MCQSLAIQAPGKHQRAVLTTGKPASRDLLAVAEVHLPSGSPRGDLDASGQYTLPAGGWQPSQPLAAAQVNASQKL